MIVLDTDHISLLQWGGPEAIRIHQRLERAGWARPPTTIITYEEQMRGWMGELSSAKTVARMVHVYGKLAEHIRFYSTLQILDFSEVAAVEFQRLKGLKLRVGTMDLRIAAVALANNATVWTRNLVDFVRVPGLKVEDASIP